MSASSLILSAPEALDRLPCPSMPSFESSRLDNGLRVSHLRRGMFPIAHMLCSLPFGGQDDPVELPGLSAFLMPLLKVAATSRSAADVRALLDSTGAEIAAWADWETGVVSIETRSSHVGPLLKLLSEVVFAPAFPEHGIGAMRGRQLGALGRLHWTPSRRADLTFARSLYGDTLYGRPLIGNEQSIRRIGREDLLEAHQRWIGAAPQVDFVVVGQFDADQVHDILAGVPRRQGVDEGVGREVALPSEPPRRDRIRLRLVDDAVVQQTELRVGHEGLSRRHPHFHFLRLLSRMLSRRLMERLRESEGMTYRVEAKLEARLGVGSMMISTALPHGRAGEAVLAMLNEMQRLQQEPIPETELIAAKQRFVGGFLRSCQTARHLAIKIKQLSSIGLGPDYFDLQVQSIRAIDAESLQKIARSHLHPDRAIITALGPKDILAPQMKRLSESYRGANL